MNRNSISGLCLAGLAFFVGCSAESEPAGIFQPKKIIDLGALVTEDLAFRVWGAELLAQYGIDRPNVFETVINDIPTGDGRSITSSNAFYTLANHGGPHVDAPVHVDLGSGIDSYDVGAFTGPLKVFDVSEYPAGRTIPKDVFDGAVVDPGDVVLIYTGWTPATDDSGSFKAVSLTYEAAEYLAEIPVSAFGTDALSVFVEGGEPVGSTDPHVQALPIHYAFLSRGIPLYEQLFNVGQTLGHERMYFVGAPLNIKDGDGMIVRPLVFVY